MATLLPALLVGAVVAALLALGILHGVLRPFMHARGVQPWTLRDTLGSTVLVTMGAALVGAGSTLAIARFAADLASTSDVLVAFVLMGAGAVAVRLGLLALRKLT